MIVSRNKEWKDIHTFLPGPSLFPGTKYGGSTSIHSCQAFTDSRNKEWQHIHRFLPGFSQFPGTKKGSTSIHSFLDHDCFQEQRMEGHPYILVRAFTVSRNKEWRKHIHTFLPGPSLITGTENGSTFIHSFQAFTVCRNKVWKHIRTVWPCLH